MRIQPPSSKLSESAALTRSLILLFFICALDLDPRLAPGFPASVGLGLPPLPAGAATSITFELQVLLAPLPLEEHRSQGQALIPAVGSFIQKSVTLSFGKYSCVVS